MTKVFLLVSELQEMHNKLSMFTKSDNVQNITKFYVEKALWAIEQALEAEEV